MATNTDPLRARRTVRSAVTYRGKARPIIAVIDPKQSTITVRLKGCRKTRTYQLEDLYTWGPQLSLI